ISSAERPDPSRNAFSRFPMSSKRSGMTWSTNSPPSCPPLCRPPRLGGHCVSKRDGRDKPGHDRKLLRRLVPLGCVQRRQHDVLVACVAAEIAGDRDPHLLLGRVRIVAQEFGEGGEHPRRAEAALQAVVVAKRL